MLDSLWNAGSPWASIEASDPSPYTLGTVFAPLVAGSVLGVRFYRTGSEPGFGSGRGVALYNTSGTLLASATSTPAQETGSGWRDVLFASPVAASIGAGYVTAAQALTYPAYPGYFVSGPGASGIVSAVGFLSGPAAPPSGNGRFVVNGVLDYPTQTYNGGCYFVDTIFSPA